MDYIKPCAEIVYEIEHESPRLMPGFIFHFPQKTGAKADKVTFIMEPRSPSQPDLTDEERYKLAIETVDNAMNLGACE